MDQYGGISGLKGLSPLMVMEAGEEFVVEKSWFLKMHRIALNPDFQSVRNQSKEEGLSTIEAIAFALKNLGEKPVIAESLIYQYKKLIGTII
jgi:hypothetical protein